MGLVKKANTKVITAPIHNRSDELNRFPAISFNMKELALTCSRCRKNRSYNVRLVLVFCLSLVRKMARDFFSQSVGVAITGNKLMIN